MRTLTFNEMCEQPTGTIYCEVDPETWGDRDVYSDSLYRKNVTLEDGNGFWKTELLPQPLRDEPDGPASLRIRADSCTLRLSENPGEPPDNATFHVFDSEDVKTLIAALQGK